MRGSKESNHFRPRISFVFQFLLLPMLVFLGFQIQGFKTDTGTCEKSSMFRETTVKSYSIAVAAISPSITPTGVPFRFASALRCPQCSATKSLTGTIRPAKRSLRLSSQVLKISRLFPEGMLAIPLRISPIVRTLRYRDSSFTDENQRTTLWSGETRMSSEIQLVLIR